ARERRQLGERQRTAADARDRLFHRAARRRCEPLGACANGRRLLVQHPQNRHLAQRALGLEVEEEGSLECRQPELVDPERAVKRVAAETLDELGAADDDAGRGARAPRETSTSRPSASAARASSIAAALLLTTIAASAPVSRFRIPAT